MKSYRKLLTLLIVIVVISLVLLFFNMNKKQKKDDSLGVFKITSVEKVDDDITVLFEKSKNAVNYVVTVYDENDNIILQKEDSKNRISIQDCHAEYEELIKIQVTAFDKNQEPMVSSNLYEYNWINPSFDDKSFSAIVTKNFDFPVKIMGDVYENQYKIGVLYQNEKIYTVDVESNYVLIPYDKIKDYDGRLTAVLYTKSDTPVHTMNFYNNPVLVSKVMIISPTYNEDLYWDEVNLTFTGGENATVYKVNIYYNNKLQSTVFGSKSEIKIPATSFKENHTYKLELVAMYGDYEEIAKRATVTINIGEKLKVTPVYVDRAPDHVKAGTRVQLLTKTPGATIKFTVDGSNPEKKGVEYTGPIIVDRNMKIRAIAVKDNLKSSDITTFDFKINNSPVVVYLSPSNQYKNLGVKKVGYTNEREMMNKVADKIQANLESKGVKVLRNNPENDMMVWLKESRTAHANLHFAIHSNGSTNHDTKGMEIYVNDSSSKMLSLATLMYYNLYDIYPYQSEETNRGIKYADGSLGEVNPLNTQVGILIEIAHHDDIDDAKWMVDNLDQISNNISSTILKYYGIS